MFKYEQSLPGLEQLCKTTTTTTAAAARFAPGETDRIRNCSLHSVKSSTGNKINSNEINNNNNNNNRSKWQEQGVQTEPPTLLQQQQDSISFSSSSSATSSASSSANLSSSSRPTSLLTGGWPTLPGVAANQTAANEQTNQQRNGCILLLNSLPQVVNNSALVRQRASAKDCLAAASVNAGASVPLMAGGCNRKCLPPECANLIADGVGGLEDNTANYLQQTNHQHHAHHHNNLQQQQQQYQLAPVSNPVPKNTALRAEQRKQNMVSVVRPVVSSANNNNGQLDAIDVNPIKAVRVRLEDSQIWVNQQQQQQHQQKQASSVLEDFMLLDRQITQLAPTGSDYLISSDKANQMVDLLDDHLFGRNCKQQKDQFSEQQARQQAALFRREEFELNRTVRKQHKFLLTKLAERKRGLQIVQAVWVQKGFKEAIERLVDIYHQGLIFTTTANNLDDDYLQEDSLLFGTQLINNNNNRKQKQINLVRNQNKSSQLNSLNTSLVVDVLGIIILRPKLWNLEICQLLLPIINHDLMMQLKPGYENYLEVALKAIKLILTNFSTVIITTLDSQKDGQSNRTLVGVDLSREDRLNKCLNCCKLLLEARLIIKTIQPNNFINSSGNKTPSNGEDRPGNLNSIIYRELDQLFATFESSIDPSQLNSLLRRSNVAQDR